MKHNEYLNDFEHDIVGSCPHDLFYVSPAPPDLESMFLQVNRAGIALETPKDFLIHRDDTYRFCLLHCVVGGRGVVTVRGHSHVVEKGQVFLLGANEEHSYYSDSQSPLGVVWAEFCGGNSVQLVRHILDTGGCVYGAPVFKDLTDKCTALLYQKKPYGPRISQILYDMLMLLCAYADDNRLLGVSSSKILNYIDENLDHMLTLKEVAAVFGYHPAYFSSLFSHMMGISFSKYIMDRKISYSCYLLEATSWPIDRIARELGFCDVSHFTKRFKEAKNMSPSVYRTGCRNHPAAGNSFLK